MFVPSLQGCYIGRALEERDYVSLQSTEQACFPAITSDSGS